MPNVNKLSFIIFLFFLLSGCNKDDVEIDPAKAILGKWELIESGTSFENLEPVSANGYEEYLLDSTKRFYDYDLKGFAPSHEKYWIKDSLLVTGVPRSDGVLFTIRYKYKFFSKNNKLRLDIEAYAIYNTFIYKRI